MNFGCQAGGYKIPHHRQYLFVGCKAFLTIPKVEYDKNIFQIKNLKSYTDISLEKRYFPFESVKELQF